VIPVDLFGRPADAAALGAIAERYGMFVLTDAAQSFGAMIGNRRVGGFGLMTATSFFPAKPLGCYGDGGAVFTDDDALAEVLRSVRCHGQGADRYDNVRLGINGRFDTLQAAILIEKLAIFEDEIAARHAVAARYADGLRDLVQVPKSSDGMVSVWAQYTLVLNHRDEVAAALGKQGIPTAVYYPRPLHRQLPFSACPLSPTGLPVTERLAGQVLSLPMGPYLDPLTQQRIVDAVRRALSN
jgi:dTDP-4-amino-4,6-dideoxygalactose transaminase